MRARTANPLALALFWLGVQAVWGALLGISLQARSKELVPADAVIAYSRLATTGALVAAVTQVAIGFWSDARRSRQSRRVEFYVVGALGGAAALALFYDARTFATLTVAFILLQAALNVAIGPYQAIIPDFVERVRIGGASSWMAALQGIGNAVGALLAAFLTNARALSASLGGLLLATCAVTASHAARLPLQKAPDEASRPFRVTRPFVDLFISRALVYVGFYTLLGYLLFYVTDVLGVTALKAASRETGILIVAFTVLGAVGARLAARPTDRLDKRLVATLGAAGLIVGLAVFIASHATPGVAVATLLAGLGWGVFLVADWAIACRVLPPGAMAAAMGIWNLAIVLPQVVAPGFTGLVLQALHLTLGPDAPRVAFGLALCETLVGIAWLWRLSRCAIGE
jgi:MFS family permease